ncbi:DegV family protein [Eubacterium ventriosum]|uniref:DegV family protein n=1 Tax=Eubacterium ventriosum TaxID=39496 RepID=A0A413T7W2_9FIRM|nr:DegV family protein [Eubacterium ventriosum]RHA53495.1 DegV family protein [Eubacterium ventriosum]RHA80929.1 DegV family protein [Eubacterium ventriosum]
MYKIVSDSACDLSKEYLEKHDVTIVPLSVSFDGETYYRDGVDITRDECYQRMVDDPKLFPKTSLPSVESYAEVFRNYVEQGFPVVCFTITTLFSGSYNSAMNAKSLVEEDYPDANICVIDSKQNTVTQALLIDQFVKMLEDGLSFEQAMSKLDALMASARIFFTVGSLDYLKMGGRIGKVATAATGKLGVKPVIIMKDGDIGLGGIGRNRNKLKNSVLQVAKKYLDENNKDNFIVSVGYGYDKEEGFEFMKEVESTLDVKLDSETNVAIGIVSAVHTGPYPIGLGVIRKYETL